jgi:two-component system chemotaxis response regulator CheY
MFKILIVDDAPFMRNSLVKLFREKGWQVVGEAGNGREAIAQYQALRPDVVTMDITMPELDGIGAVKAIRSNDPGARVVMCSALGQQDRVVEAIRSGARDFIVKPFHKDRVFAAIEKVMGVA